MSKLTLVKQSVRIMELLPLLGMQLDRSNFCKCPIHGENTASLKVYPSTNSWHCFGCHSGGDVIDLAQGVLGLDLNGAVTWLGEQFGISDKPLSRHDRQRVKALQNKRERERAENLKLNNLEHDCFCELVRLEHVRDTSTPGSEAWIDAIKKIDLAEFRWREAQAIARDRRTSPEGHGHRPADGG